MITITQLEYIVAVDTYRHFVTASEKCFVTQPTLSMQIKKLEEYLGVAIFDRTKQPIIPTEIGEKVIAQARQTIAEHKKINDVVKEFQDTISGELAIGIIPSLAPYLLPLFIGKFTKKYPDVTVKIVELLTDEIVDQLRKDTIDVGILVTPLQEQGISEKILFYEKMLLYTSKSHPISKNRKVSVDEIATPDLWLLTKGHCFRSQAINLCAMDLEIQNSFPFEYESGSLETIKKIVEKEGGYTLIPELAVPDSDENKNAVIKEFNGTTPIREVSFAYSRNYAKAQLLDLLSKEITASVPREMLNRERGQIVEWK